MIERYNFIDHLRVELIETGEVLKEEIDHIGEQIITKNWWCSLHEEALKRIGTNWIRPSDFTDRPEVVRDIASLGLIESMEEKKGQYTILWWRLKTNHNTNKL